MINIIKATSTTNTDRTPNRAIKYIVIHYTAGVSSKKGTARNVASMFGRGSVGGSADFIVDDAEIVQYNGDIKNRSCWAVGGAKYKSMSTSVGGTYYSKCNNHNSISIEMCSNKTNKKTLLASDTDWYITEATVNNCVELTKYLMQQYKIPVSNVIMHHHVTGKVCPNPWCVNERRLTQWSAFKQRLTETPKEVDDEMVTGGKIIANGKEYKCDKILKDNQNFIKASNFNNMGFTVGYNASTKAITIDNKTSDLTVNYEGKDDTVKAVNLGGYNYVAIKDIAKVIGKKAEYKDGKVVIE